MVEVYATELLAEDKFLRIKDHLLSSLKPERKDRILRFRFHADAQRSLLGDVMVRSIISKKLKLKNSHINFKISDKGKPAVKDNPGIYFNVSHAGSWVVAAFSENEIGVDIEKVKKINFNIAEQFFSLDEINSLNKLNGEEKLDFFFELWTMKESYLKYTGKGLSEPLNSFTVKKSGSNFKLSHHNIKEKVYLKQYSIEKGYKLAVCSELDDFFPEIHFVDINECINSL